MTVGDLRYGGYSGLALRLTVRDLGDGTDGGGTSGTSAGNDVEVDGLAVCGNGFIVEVGEGAAQALVEDGLRTKSKLGVLDDRPPGSVDGTILRRIIELKLVVGGDVAGPVLAVLKDSTLESAGENA